MAILSSDAIGKRSKILLIPDMPGWAFDANATQIMLELEKVYDFTKKYADDLKKQKDFDYSIYDCIYLFYWKHRKLLNLNIPKEKLITGVFSYTSWQNKKRVLKKELSNYSAVITPIEELSETFKSLKYKTFTIYHSVDTKKFYPIKDYKKESDKLIVGWVGNPDHLDKNYKGYWSKVKPVCDKNNDWIELKSALSSDKIPHSKMVDFYNSIDVLVCMSKGETGPYPVLEAGACGIPVISTSVGLIPKLISSNKNGIIVKRTTGELYNALRELYKNPEKRIKLGATLRAEIIKNWSIQKTGQEYKRVFDTVINASKNTN